MQGLIVLLLGLLVGGAVLAVAHAVRVTRRPTVRSLATIGRYGYDSAAALAPVPGTTTSNQGLEQAMASIARRLSREDYEQRLKLRLLQAGMYGSRPSRFLMIRVLSMMSLAVIGLTRASSTSNRALALMFVVVPPFLGWMIPDSMLSMRIKRRQEQIERDAADLIDLLAITVHAGLGLDQALKVSAEKLQGPLADEVRLMLNEVRVGQSRQEALRRFSERVDTPTIRSFCRSIAQSESMGVSITQTLKALAVEARARRRSAAEEKAQKAPIKMVFPLAICIFPAILIVSAGPGILSVVKALGS